MALRYVPLSALELDALAIIGGFDPPSYTGPSLPRPAGAGEAITELFGTFDHLLTRAQYLIQVKNGLTIPFTLRGITATAERFMLGTESEVESIAALRALVTLIEEFLERIGSAQESADVVAAHVSEVKTKLDGWEEMHLLAKQSPAPAGTPPDPQADYAAFALEHIDQFSMAWTTLQDTFRDGYPHVPEYVARVEDPQIATETFWPSLASTALPYNLLILRRLQAGTVEPFKTNFGSSWSAEFDQMLGAGRLYGIDMTIFMGLLPETVANGTMRVTPSTMALLEMGEDRNLRPIAVYVADPEDINNAQIYTPASGAWVYSLLAIQTSLTVHGIWLGHVYSLHIVTAALQMEMWNTFSADHIVHQAVAPQSNFTIPFDLLLLLAWPNLSPPTSISDPGKFLTLCARFAATHDFFSTDPAQMLASLNLDPSDFTNPGQQPWNRYPNVQRMLRVWEMTETYLAGVVDAGYASDAEVASDAQIAAWIASSSQPSGGNVAGLPHVNSKASLKHVLTSLMYRINFHGLGRLRSMGSPFPSFATNFPPCLQSKRIPPPGEKVTTSSLLSEFLPRTGTLGGLISFYDLFSFSAPYEPLVPEKGETDALFFDNQKYPGANAALISFRQQAAALVKEIQPEWVQVGQWPKNIEL